MSSTAERNQEVKQDNKNLRIGRMINGGLASAIGRAGGTLLGFSVKLGQYDCLITLRVQMPGGKVIAFVGGETLGGCVLKAAREAGRDKLRWKDDIYRK